MLIFNLFICQSIVLGAVLNRLLSHIKLNNKSSKSSSRDDSHSHSSNSGLLKMKSLFSSSGSISKRDSLLDSTHASSEFKSDDDGEVEWNDDEIMNTYKKRKEKISSSLSIGQSIEEKSHDSSSLSLSLSSSKEETKWQKQAYHPRLSTIIVCISILPLDIVKIISFYDYNERLLGKLYKAVMKQLRVTDKEMTRDLDFYSVNFVKSLYEIFLIKEKEINVHDLWYDLSRLLFKWMIYMKQGKNNTELIKVSKLIQSIALMSDSSMSFPSSFNLKSLSAESISILKIFMDWEFMENPHTFDLFRLILNDFYNRGIDFDTLENVYFEGDFNSNFLLKFMIIIYDPIGRIRRDCFLIMTTIFDKSHNGKDLLDPESTKMPISSKYLDNLESSLILSFDTCIQRMNGSIVEFFLKHNHKVLIDSPCNLSILIKRLKKSKLLTIKTLEKIIKFKPPHQQWCKSRFQKLLSEAIKKQHISLNLYLECMELFKDAMDGSSSSSQDTL